MPRYFFNIEDHVREPDEEGIDLAGPGEARIEAVVFAGAYLRDNPALLEGGQPFVVDVRDDAGGSIVRVVVVAE